MKLRDSESDRDEGGRNTLAAGLDLLEHDAWLGGVAARLRDAAGLRNALVNGRAEVDPGIVSDVMAHRLGDPCASRWRARRVRPLGLRHRRGRAPVLSPDLPATDSFHALPRHRLEGRLRDVRRIRSTHDEHDFAGRIQDHRHWNPAGEAALDSIVFGGAKFIVDPTPPPRGADPSAVRMSGAGLSIEHPVRRVVLQVVMPARLRPG